jgi:hypothetical protein
VFFIRDYIIGILLFSPEQVIVEEYDGNQMMDSMNKNTKGESSKENEKKKEMSKAPDKKEYKTPMLRSPRNRRIPSRYLE